MPVEIARHGRKWCVVEPDGTIIACHDTEEGALDQQRAINAELEKAVAKSKRWAVKQVGENGFGGYTAIWGSPDQRDLDGEYFTTRTDFALEAYPSRPVIYDHGMNRHLDRTIIGTIKKWNKDDVGLWVEGDFKRMTDDVEVFTEEERRLRDKYIQVIKEKIAAGELNFSSGALAHLVKVAFDGEIEQWWWGESSTTGTPAEPRRTELQLLKAVPGIKSYKVGQSLEAVTENPAIEGAAATENTPVTPEISAQEGALDADAGKLTVNPSENQEKNPMNPEEIINEIAGMNLPPEVLQQLAEELMRMVEQATAETVEAVASAETEEGKAAPAPPVTPEMPVEMQLAHWMNNAAFLQKFYNLVQKSILRPEDLRARIAQVKGAQPPAGAGGKIVPATAPARVPQLHMKSKYERAGYTAEDYDFHITYMNARLRDEGGWQAPREFLNEAFGKLIDNAANAGYEAKAWNQLQENAARVKSDELEYTSQTGYGAEWQGQQWSSQIIQKARTENPVLGLFTTVEMPSNPYNLPIEGTDPTVYAVPETSDQSQLTYGSGNAGTMSKIGTAALTLTAKKLKVWIGMSEEELEDQIVPILPQKRNQAQRAIQDAIDSVLLNADPDASGNINYNGAALGATSLFRYGGGYGLAYVPLKTDTDYLVNMGGTPTLSALWAIQRKLKAAYQIRQSDLAFVCDVPTWMAIREIPQFLTVDKYGSNATVLTGEQGMIGKIPLIATEQLALTAEDGLVSSTAGNNKYGRVLIFYRPNLFVGYRRRIRVSVETIELFEATQIAVSVRLATTRFDDQSIAMLKNITVQ